MADGRSSSSVGTNSRWASRSATTLASVAAPGSCRNGALTCGSPTTKAVRAVVARICGRYRIVCSWRTIPRRAHNGCSAPSFISSQGYCEVSPSTTKTTRDSCPMLSFRSLGTMSSNRARAWSGLYAVLPTEARTSRSISSGWRCCSITSARARSDSETKRSSRCGSPTSGSANARPTSASSSGASTSALRRLATRRSRMGAGSWRGGVAAVCSTVISHRRHASLEIGAVRRTLPYRPRCRRGAASIWILSSSLRARARRRAERAASMAVSM